MQLTLLPKRVNNLIVMNVIRGAMPRIPTGSMQVYVDSRIQLSLCGSNSATIETPVLRYLSTQVDFFCTSQACNGLVEVWLAALFLAVSRQRLQFLVDHGRFSRYFYAGKLHLSCSEVRAFWEKRNGGGQ